MKAFGLCRITRDLELSAIKGKDTSYVRFGVAYNNWKDEAMFYNCVAYGKNAENLAKFCGKGSQIVIDGDLETGSYEHKDGYTVYTTTIKVNRFDFAGGKSDRDATTTVKNKPFNKKVNTQTVVLSDEDFEF